MSYDVSNFDDLGVFYEIFIKREYGKIPQGNVTIIDIGANNWLFMLYCKKENPNAIIHCYEPVPACADHVKQVAKENHFHDVHVHELAVSDTRGEQKLFLGDQTVAASLYEDIASGHNAITIKTDTLEHIFWDNHIHILDFLKVDCEGGEYDIFYNISRETLQKCKTITIEYHDIDKAKNGKKLYEHLKEMLPYNNVVYHHHPAHPHNGFITVR